MNSFETRYSNYQKIFEQALEEFYKQLKCKPDILGDSLKYSLQLGGKRIRPVLMLAVGELLNIKKEDLLNFAVALEVIHTYSLIHDDLPEMDNDDFRRGKPSNHKVFGVGNAVLAGDGLLNTAYSILFSECFKGELQISAAKYICDCAGIKGMIAGQSADLLHEHDENVDEDILNFIYENKTSKLIMAATVVPSILCSGKQYSTLTAFGRNLGYLFQVTDDILDIEGNFESLGKSIGKDNQEGKYTAVRLYGLNGSKLKADLMTDNCLKLLESFSGDISFLRDLTYFVRQRIH